MARTRLERAGAGAGQMDVQVRAGIQWVGAYNVYHAKLYGWIDLETAWEDGGGYVARVCGHKLNQRFQSHLEAAEALVTFLRDSLKKLDQLP